MNDLMFRSCCIPFCLLIFDAYLFESLVFHHDLSFDAHTFSSGLALFNVSTSRLPLFCLSSCFIYWVNRRPLATCHLYLHLYSLSLSLITRYHHYSQLIFLVPRPQPLHNTTHVPTSSQQPRLLFCPRLFLFLSPKDFPPAKSEAHQ